MMYFLSGLDRGQKTFCCRTFAPARPDYPAASLRDFLSGAYKFDADSRTRSNSGSDARLTFKSSAKESRPVIRNQLPAYSVESVALEKADAEIAHMKNAIHHLDLNVSDLERSGPFYDQLLTQIGFRRVNLSTPAEPGGFDWIAPGDKNTRFSIGMYRAISPNKSHDRHAPGIHHLALRANRRQDVDGLYRMLLEMKAEILSAPCEYPQYEAGYYAVFFLDPDGIKLEYVYVPD